MLTIILGPTISECKGTKNIEGKLQEDKVDVFTCMSVACTKHGHVLFQIYILRSQIQLEFRL